MGMFRSILLIILLCTSGAAVIGQTIANSEWAKIQIKRKDGSKIVDRAHTERLGLTYKFKDSTVTIITEGQSSYEEQFYVNENLLSIGNFLKFHIDTMTNFTLVLTEVFNQYKSADKINSIIFIRKPYHFKFLLQNKQIEVQGDSMVLCNTQFSPIYTNGNLGQLVSTQVDQRAVERSLTGFIVLSSKGVVENVDFENVTNFYKEEIEKVAEALKRTSGKWTIPTGVPPLKFQINFSINVRNYLPTFTMHRRESESLPFLTAEKISEANDRFTKALKLASQGNDSKAILEFNKVIAIDTFYLDAYYNKASLFFKTGDKESACNTWSILKSMGQVQGEALFNEHCNK